MGFLLLSIQVRSGIREPPQILCDLFSTSQRVEILSIDSLLLLVLPLAVHDTDLEMITPFRLQDVLLAVWTLLDVGFVFLLRLAHVVLHNAHVWV